MPPEGEGKEAVGTLPGPFDNQTICGGSYLAMTNSLKSWKWSWQDLRLHAACKHKAEEKVLELGCACTCGM